jgi:FkbM family methyltransferase
MIICKGCETQFEEGTKECPRCTMDVNTGEYGYGQLKPENIQNWHDNFVGKHIQLTIRLIESLIAEYELDEVHFVDIGSNTGIVTDKLCESSNVVSATLIEPMLPFLEFSKFLINKHPATRFEFLDMGISDQCGFMNISIAGEFEGPATNLGMGRITHDNRFPKTAVHRFNKMNHLLDTPRFNLVKIDTEGEDVKVLMGLYDHIVAYGIKPVIIFESASYRFEYEKPLVDNIMQKFFEYGYKPFEYYERPWPEHVLRPLK